MSSGAAGAVVGDAARERNSKEEKNEQAMEPKSPDCR